MRRPAVSPDFRPTFLFEAFLALGDVFCTGRGAEWPASAAGDCVAFADGVSSRSIPRFDEPEVKAEAAALPSRLSP
jgi:hypothetical protein